MIEVDIDIEEGVGTVKPQEDIDLTNAEELKDRVVELLDKDVTDIILDLNNVEKIDSSGLGKILLFEKMVEENEGEFTIINVNSDYINKVFKTIDLEGVVNIE